MLLIKVLLIKKHVTWFSKNEAITLQHQFVFGIYPTFNSREWPYRRVIEGGGGGFKPFAHCGNLFA